MGHAGQLAITRQAAISFGYCDVWHRINPHTIKLAAWFLFFRLNSKTLNTIISDYVTGFICIICLIYCWLKVFEQDILHLLFFFILNFRCWRELMLIRFYHNYFCSCTPDTVQYLNLYRIYIILKIIYFFFVIAQNNSEKLDLQPRTSRRETWFGKYIFLIALMLLVIVGGGGGYICNVNTLYLYS